MSTGLPPGHLLVIDRRTGEVERISSTDRNCDVSISRAAIFLGISTHEAVAFLRGGGMLQTPGFARRFQPS